MPTTVLITGAASGLGFACTRALLAREAVHVLAAVRGVKDAEHAFGGLPLEQRARLTIERGDLADLSSVARLAHRVGAREHPAPLRAIVANAGVQTPGRLDRTAQRFETTFAVNHLAHFALVRALLPHLHEPARVLFVASAGHDPAQRTGMPAPRLADVERLARPELDPDAPPVSSARSWRERYATSKLANVLTAYELDRRMRAAGRDIRANAFDPGGMLETNLLRDWPAALRVPLRAAAPALSRFVPGISTAERSGATLAALAVDEAYAGVGGSYVSIDRGAQSSQASHDARLAAQLWEQSERLLDATREELSPPAGVGGADHTPIPPAHR